MSMHGIHFSMGLRRILASVLLAFVGIELSAQDSLAFYNHVFLDAVVERQKGNDAAAFELFRRCTQLDSTAAEAH